MLLMLQESTEFRHVFADKIKNRWRNGKKRGYFWVIIGYRIGYYYANVKSV